MRWRGAEQLRPLLRPLEGLTPSSDDPRVHGEKNLAAIAKSINGHGQVDVVVVYAGEIIVGNGRVTAMKGLGWTHVAVIDVTEDFPNREQALAFSIADNRTGELAEWDPKKLAATMSTLKPTQKPWTAFEESGPSLAGTPTKPARARDESVLILTMEQVVVVRRATAKIKEEPAFAAANEEDLLTIMCHRFTQEMDAK